MEKWKGSGELKTQPIASDFFSSTDQVLLAWLGASGFLLNVAGKIVLIDPLIMPGDEPETSEIGLKFATQLPITATQLPHVDFVLYTHSDADHMGAKTALELAKTGAVFVGTYASYYRLTQLGVPPRQCKVCRYDDPFYLEGIKVDITPCDHPWQLKDLKRGGLPFRAGDCCGFILNTPQGRIFFPGDTRLMEEHLRIEDVDLLALDVSLDENHLTHRYAAVLANHFSNAWLLPYHYGTFITDNPAHIGEPAALYPLISNSGSRALMPDLGEIITLSVREAQP